MPAYVISEVTARDPELLARYRELAAVSIERHGGRYLVRGATPAAAEGTWPANARCVIVEFPTMQDVERWYASDEYASALAIRDAALERRLLFVDGVAAAGGQGP